MFFLLNALAHKQRVDAACNIFLCCLIQRAGTEQLLINAVCSGGIWYHISQRSIRSHKELIRHSAAPLAEPGIRASYSGLCCAFTHPPSKFNQDAKPFNCLTPDCVRVKQGQHVLITLARLTAASPLFHQRKCNSVAANTE